MRRSTCTTTVFVILLEVTTPMRLLGRPRFAAWFSVFSDISPLGLLGGRRLCGDAALLLVEHREHPRQVAPVLAQIGARVERPGGVADAQVEDVLAHLVCAPRQLFDGKVSQLAGLHLRLPAPPSGA